MQGRFNESPLFICFIMSGEITGVRIEFGAITNFQSWPRSEGGGADNYPGLSLKYLASLTANSGEWSLSILYSMKAESLSCVSR